MIPIVGKLIETVIGKGADLISEFITDKDKQAEFNHKLAVAMLEDGQFTQQIEKEMFEAQQATIQAELHQSDLYTKQTRPKIARQSWYVTGAYAVAGTFIPALPSAWGLNIPTMDWQIFMVLASPALTYMGVRGVEKFKAGGSK